MLFAAEMLGITAIDWGMVVLYLIGITLIGTWAARKVKSAASFFISDRRFGPVMMMFFNFGTGTHSDQAVSVSAKTYRAGASGIWYQWLWLFCTPFYWLISPMFRRMRAVTCADFFECRFNQNVAMLYAIVGIFQLTVNIGVMLKGSSAMIEAVSGHAIDPAWAIGAMTVMFLIYGVAGGLSAAIATDFIQGVLTIILSFLILPFALWTVGGMAGMKATIDDPHMFSLVAPGEITLFFIIVVSLNGLIGYGTQPHTMSLAAAGRTEMESRVGMTYGMFIKRLCTVAWVITGLAALAFYMARGSAELIDVDHVYGLMARELLPDIMPGLVGLFIASMLAAVMSSCDAFMVACSALFTENVYRKVIVPDGTDRHYMWVGRGVSIVVVAAGILFAFSLESVVTGLEIFWKLSAMMGIAFWIGLFWRRATPAGAWAATLVGFAVFLGTSSVSFVGVSLWDFNAHYAEQLPRAMQKNPALVPEIPESVVTPLTAISDLPDPLRREIENQPNFSYRLRREIVEFLEARAEAAPDDAQLDQLDQLRDAVVQVELHQLSLPWQMIGYLSAGIVAMIGVSLLTPRVSKEQLDRFYGVLRTPIGPDEPEVPPFTLPPGTEPAPRRVWFDRFELELPVITRVGAIGFLAATVAVLALVAAVYWLFSLGGPPGT